MSCKKCVLPGLCANYDKEKCKDTADCALSLADGYACFKCKSEVGCLAAEREKEGENDA